MILCLLFARASRRSACRDNTVTLWAMWKSTKPSYKETCNQTGIVLKDGRCWGKQDIARPSSWPGTSYSGCSGIWRLPSIQEFDELLLAYFPSAPYNSTYQSSQYNTNIHIYNGDASIFFSDWGFQGVFWASTGVNWMSGRGWYASTGPSYFQIYPNDGATSSMHVRCVSDI